VRTLQSLPIRHRAETDRNSMGEALLKEFGK